MFKYIIFFVFALFAFCNEVLGQDVILTNPSFEGRPTQGDSRYQLSLNGWSDCGPLKFPGESPPDIHPNNYWTNPRTGEGVDLTPANGNSYIGMVVRKNNTYESITQQLEQPLKQDQCYIFSIDLARELDYWSGISGVPRSDTFRFSTPIVLRIWGSNTPCFATNRDVPQLLGESDPVDYEEWKTTVFSQIKPTKDFRYITLEAFYKTPLFEPYLGHVLVDNASTFVAIDCDDDQAVVKLLASEPEEVEVAEATPNVQPKQQVAEPDTKVPDTPNKPSTTASVKSPITQTKPTPPQREKIIKELDEKKLVTGQKIKIEKLYFEADSTRISEDSYEVLEEVASFLKANDNIKVEIGGHTNGIPKHDYCDQISTARARAVANHLIELGVAVENLEYKGYGKRQPIASNNSIAGRKRNQRVEIKVLKV